MTDTLTIDRFIHETDKGYRWFVYVVDSGHVLAQGYHKSEVIAGNQMASAFLNMAEEWGNHES